jgi:type VI secretion system protein ImpH
MIGLTGAMGVLPRFYSETLATTLRDRSYALHDFLDLLGHRFIALFARAGIKYRLPRAAETAREVQPRETHEGGQAVDSISLGILALTGFATPHLTDRLAVGIEPLLHYAGFFAARPRSAERLGAMVADWLGHPVEVVQFAGGWLPLPREERSRLPVGRQPGAWNQLGKDAAIGVRSWDVQARIVLRVGPLNRAAFEALLPDQPGLARLVSLARAFLGYETGFAINPVLIREDIPALILQPGAPSAPRLGWNTWVPGTEKARQNGVEPMFEAELVELSNNAIGQ